MAPIRWVMMSLALAVSGFLIAVLILLWRCNHLAYYAAVISLVVIVVLSVTDQFGLPDLVSLLVSLAALVLLLKDRSWYLHKEGAASPRK